MTISPDPKRLVVEEPFDCERDCRARDGSWDDAARSARGCRRVEPLIGLRPVEAKPTARALYQLQRGEAYMGRYPDKSLAGSTVLGLPQVHSRPWEDPEQGCPGAYYRVTLVDDLWPLLRRRTRDGGRVPNPAFDRSHWMAQQAVMHLEHEEERWHAYIEAEQARRASVELEKAKRERR